MSDEKKPPSQLDENEEEKEEKKEIQYTKGLIVLFNDNMTSYKIVENFEYGDKEYNSIPEVVPIMLNIVNESIKLRQQANANFSELLKQKINVPLPSGEVQKFTLVELIAQMTSSLTIQQVQALRSSKPGGLVNPEGKPIITEIKKPS